MVEARGKLSAQVLTTQQNRTSRTQRRIEAAYVPPKSPEQQRQEDLKLQLSQRIQQLEREKNELQSQYDEATQKKQRATRRELAVQINKKFGEIEEARRLLKMADEYSFEYSQADKSISQAGSQREKEERLSAYSSRKQQEQQEAQKKRKELERAIKEARQGGKFVRIREEFKGTPQQEKIYAVSPSGKFTLISESEPTPTFKSRTIEPSKIGEAIVAQSYKIGDLKLQFTGKEKIYKTEKGELATPYGSLGKTESEILESQSIEQEKVEQERKEKAAYFVSERGFEEKVLAPTKDERSLGGKIWDYTKALYGSTIFGTSLKMPEEFLEKRKPFRLELGAMPSGFIGIYSLDYGTALKGIQAQRSKEKEAAKQLELIQELDKITGEAPQELQYDVQQKGLSVLQQRGIRSEVDEESGLIKFTSKSFEPSKSFNIFEFEKAQQKEERAFAQGSPFVRKFTTPESKEQISLPYQTRGTAFFDPTTKKYKAPTTEVTIPAKTITISPYTAGVGLRIAATKGVEVYAVGKGIGAALTGIGKGGGAIYEGLGGGFKVTEATVRGGSVRAVIEPTLTSRLLSGKAGTVLKVAGTGVLYTGAAGIFIVGKARQAKSYKEAYGEIGAQVFKYETIGELAGIGGLVAEGLSKKAATDRTNREIALKNYERQIKAERVRNVKRLGQYSPFATAEYKGGGVGVKLSKKEVSELSRIYAEATGVSRPTAAKRVSETAFYKQLFTVKSPAGFKSLTSQRISGVLSERTKRGTSELAIEFVRSRGKLANVVLKATTGRGKYAVTSVFEKARLRPNQITDEFILQRTVASKVIKAKGRVIGDTVIKQFDVEQRLVNAYPYGRQRFKLKEVLELGLPKYQQSQLAKVYARAGTGAASSRSLPKDFGYNYEISSTEYPKAIRSFRIESPLYRDIGGIRVANTLREYRFVQVGKGGRQLALKNILKDIDFKNVEKVLRGTRTKTPLSKTFAQTPQEEIRSVALKRAIKAVTNSGGTSRGVLAEQRTGAYAGTGLYERTQEVVVNLPKNVRSLDISPQVQSNLKFLIQERLIGKIGIGFGTATSPAFSAATAGLLGLRSQQGIKAELQLKEILRDEVRTRSGQREGLDQPQRQRTSQIQATASVFTTPRLPTFDIPSTPTTSIIREPSPRIVPFGARTNINELLAKLVRRKKEKGIEVELLIPDFATKALGFSPEIVGSEKDALKAIRRVQTGLELRRGIRIRVPR
jgi:hypothetical protein